MYVQTPKRYTEALGRQEMRKAYDERIEQELKRQTLELIERIQILNNMHLLKEEDESIIIVAERVEII